MNLSSIDTMRLRQLPGYGKLFVALFTTLMLLVLVWVGIIYSVEEGLIGWDEVPEYSYDHSEDRTPGATAAQQQEEGGSASATDLEHNVGLAHTHINGQTLLYFTLGLVFLFTGVPPKTKRICFLLFAVSIVVHASSLTGKNSHWLFDDTLALSGVAIVVVVAYMALMIFVELAKKPGKRVELV